MADRLTQLQDAVEELATQFVATYNYLNRHHDYTPLAPNDEIRPLKTPQEIDPHPPALFQRNILELAQDLITKEQQIEALIHSLPGINHGEQQQEQRIRDLELEIREEEVKRREALVERERVLTLIDEEIVGIRRP